MNDYELLDGWLGAMIPDWWPESRTPIRVAVDVLRTLPGRGLSLVDVATRAGMHRDQFYKYMRGARTCSPRFRARVAQALGVSDGHVLFLMRIITEKMERHNGTENLHTSRSVQQGTAGGPVYQRL